MNAVKEVATIHGQFWRGMPTDSRVLCCDGNRVIAKDEGVAVGDLEVGDLQLGSFARDDRPVFPLFELERLAGRGRQGHEGATIMILLTGVGLRTRVLSIKCSQLAVSDIRRRQVAVDLLNSIVDTAIGNVFQLEQSTGGITLQEIILGVREILLKDDMDLVLLVEDFAALSGIQDVLLKVSVQEGAYAGKKVRATMRTALALTDGYLASRDTILTRAQRVWVIGNRQQSDDEIKTSVVDMVGAYLNASRWGEDGLRKRFDRRGAGEGLTDWLPPWHDEEQTDEEGEALNAFGYSSRGHALFPFNRLVLLSHKRFSQIRGV